MAAVRTDLITRDREIMSGTPVFVDTRVPVQNLIEYLAGGEDPDEFLDDFPSVRREQAVAVLAATKETLLASLDASTA